MNLEKEIMDKSFNTDKDKMGYTVVKVENALHIAREYAKANRLEPEVDVKTAELKEALKKAMFTKNMVNEKCVETDPAGNKYEVDFTDDMKYWAKLCDIDIEKCEPIFYCNR